MSAGLHHNRLLRALESNNSGVCFRHSSYIVYMDWIDCHSLFGEIVTAGSCRIKRFLFSDGLVLLAFHEPSTLHWSVCSCLRPSSVMSPQKPEAAYAESKRQFTASGREVQVPCCGIHESNGRWNMEIDKWKRNSAWASPFCGHKTGAFDNCKAVSF